MNSKLIVALVVVGVLAVTAIGLVAAQVATISAPNGTVGGASSSGFFGWIGHCFGLSGASYYGTPGSTYYGLQAQQYPLQPENITVVNPYTNATTTYQGYYGYGYGPCGGSTRFIP